MVVLGGGGAVSYERGTPARPGLSRGGSPAPPGGRSFGFTIQMRATGFTIKCYEVVRFYSQIHFCRRDPGCEVEDSVVTRVVPWAGALVLGVEYCAVSFSLCKETICGRRFFREERGQKM